MATRRVIRWMTLVLVPLAVLSPIFLASMPRSQPAAGHASPASDKRKAYDRLFRREIQKSPPTLSAVREIDLPPAIGRLRQFAVVGGRLIAIEGFPGRRVVTSDLRAASSPASVSTSRLDLADPLSIDWHPGEPDAISLYDFATGDFVTFELSPPLRERRRIRLQPGLFQPLWAGDRVIANGLFAGELVRVFIRKGGSLTAGATWGQSPFPDVPPDVAVHLNRTTMAASPARRRLALAFLYVNRLEVFGTDGAPSRSISGPTEVKLDYRTVHDRVEGIERFVRTPATRYAYVAVVADEARIYALFSGRAEGQWKEQATLADTLHVFAWTGELLGQWRLKRPVYAIALDTQTRTLYGATSVPGPAVIELDARELLSRPAPR